MVVIKSQVTTVMRSLIHDITLQHSTLPFPPNSLTRLETVVLFLLAILKHGLKLVGYLDEVEIKDNEYVLPACSVTGTMTISDADLTAFKNVFSTGDDSDKIDSWKGAINDIFLPCITSVMIPFLLVKFKAPISPLGTLNTKNRFQYMDMVACLSPVGTTTLVASLGGDYAGRRTRRGREVDVYIEARLNGQKDPYFRQIFTILEFLPFHAMPLFDDSYSIKKDEQSILDASSATSSCDITVSNDAPWLWAKFCKDYNPIHISTFVARLSGFNARLVHGNHLAAMAIHESGSLLQPFEAKKSQDKSMKKTKTKEGQNVGGRFIEVKFIKPVLLGSTVQVLSRTDEITLLKGEQTVMTIRAGQL